MAYKLNHLKVKHFTKQHPLSPLGKRIVQIGQKAAQEAIQRHKSLGNPIYYKDGEQLIKELADGTRLVVKASLDGITEIRRLP